jgi:predicted membrane channel-forming protein YqfA (hemolysin III family)
MLPNLFTKLITDFKGNIILLIPATLGIMMLLRIIPKTQWLSRFPIAIMIGTSAGINMLRYTKSDMLSQISATMINPFNAASTSAVIGNILLIVGTICGVYYFYFSKKQEGISAVPSKLGIWFLMISFGASFGYTVMARVSLLIGRLEFLLKDWLHIIK